MAKRIKEEKTIPEGMKCFQKMGGGSIRFTNRIIKSGQKFWAYQEAIPATFKDACKEVAADNGAIVVDSLPRPRIEGTEVQELVPEKFELVKALDEDGEVVKKGESALYNVVGEDEKPINEKPLRKGKAKELLETLNA